MKQLSEFTVKEIIEKCHGMMLSSSTGKVWYICKPSKQFDSINNIYVHESIDHEAESHISWHKTHLNPEHILQKDLDNLLAKLNEPKYETKLQPRLALIL